MSLDAGLTSGPQSDGVLRTPSACDPSQRRGLVICVFVACTGFFHGYDNGVVNGVFEMPAFRAHMGWPPTTMDCETMKCTVEIDGVKTQLETGDLNPNSQTAIVAFHEGMTVNGFNAAAALSALMFGSFLVDKKGRRPALILGSGLFAFGGLVQAASPNAGTLIAGRMIAGVGVGMTSSAGTAYIAEVSPAASRGAMIGGYQNNICIAIVVAAALNYAVKDTEYGWRLTLGLQLVMGLVVTIGLCFVPETPRFLAKIGKLEEAREVMDQLRGDEVVAQAELDGVIADIELEKAAGEATWKEILRDNGTFRNVVLLGCVVQFAQIITGINALVSFSGTMFRQLGVSGLNAAISPFVAFLAGNMIGSFVFVDKTGRRPILMWGMVGMAASLLAAGMSSSLLQVGSSAAGSIGIFCVVAYMFAFGASWGYGAWLYIPEIMPLRVRGKAVGLCTFVNWGPANNLSATLTPWMLREDVFGAGGTLLFFGFVCVVFIPFAVLCLPETKGQSLENIMPMFEFRGVAGFKQFVRGNLQRGNGMREQGQLQSRPATSEPLRTDP
eukprot:SAG31_NODE_5458_length_2526_cov_1.195715_2_plen_555_part_00